MIEDTYQFEPQKASIRFQNSVISYIYLLKIRLKCKTKFNLNINPATSINTHY